VSSPSQRSGPLCTTQEPPPPAATPKIHCDKKSAIAGHGESLGTFLFEIKKIGCNDFNDGFRKSNDSGRDSFMYGISINIKKVVFVSKKI